MICQHATPADEPGKGECSLHTTAYSFGMCRACLDNTAAPDWPPAKNAFQRARMGTRIKQLTTAMGIPPCGGCNGRAVFFNGDARDG